jgi:hypothetical protein
LTWSLAGTQSSSALHSFDDLQTLTHSAVLALAGK